MPRATSSKPPGFAMTGSTLSPAQPAAGRESTSSDLRTVWKRRSNPAKSPSPSRSWAALCNGPGEAREADVGIAGGDGVGMLFAKGEMIQKASLRRAPARSSFLHRYAVTAFHTRHIFPGFLQSTRRGRCPHRPKGSYEFAEDYPKNRIVFTGSMWASTPTSLFRIYYIFEEPPCRTFRLTIYSAISYRGNRFPGS